MGKKNLGKEKEGTKGTKKTYVVIGDADRVFTEAVHGFDLKLTLGEKIEVDAKTAALIKKNFSYLQVK